MTISRRPAQSNSWVQTISPSSSMGAASGQRRAQHHGLLGRLEASEQPQGHHVRPGCCFECHQVRAAAQRPAGYEAHLADLQARLPALHARQQRPDLGGVAGDEFLADGQTVVVGGPRRGVAKRVNSAQARNSFALAPTRREHRPDTGDRYATESVPRCGDRTDHAALHAWHRCGWCAQRDR